MKVKLTVEYYCCYHADGVDIIQDPLHMGVITKLIGLY